MTDVKGSKTKILLNGMRTPFNKIITKTAELLAFNS
jgi:hypothetical protein